jgi:hypothetical protein
VLRCVCSKVHASGKANAPRSDRASRIPAAHKALRRLALSLKSFCCRAIASSLAARAAAAAAAVAAVRFAACSCCFWIMVRACPSSLLEAAPAIFARRAEAQRDGAKRRGGTEGTPQAASRARPGKEEARSIVASLLQRAVCAQGREPAAGTRADCLVHAVCVQDQARWCVAQRAPVKDVANAELQLKRARWSAGLGCSALLLEHTGSGKRRCIGQMHCGGNRI